MSVTLRMAMLAAAIISVIWIFKKIYKAKVRLQDAIFWVCLAVLVALLGIFPDIAVFFSKLIGIETPVNFVFLFILALVLEKLCTLSIKVSQLEDKITILSAELAIRSKAFEKRTEEEGKKDSNP